MQGRLLVMLGVLGVGSAIPALGQGVPDYDFQWTTIGDVGNAPYHTNDPGDFHIDGRGTVNYQYRASQLEISTAQWMEFLNAFAPIDNSQLDYRGPLLWGAYRSLQLPNGHFTMSLDPLRSNAGMLPIGGISWRDAVRYCNWLTNNKEVSLAAISTGSYDTTTWGFNEDELYYTDDPRRMAGAKFFLPNIDEYLKAVHYDPNRYGPGQGGYWTYGNFSDTAPIPGPPGAGQTNSAYTPGGDPFAAWNIPLGAYPDVHSYYGLLDTNGGGSERVESDPGFTVGLTRGSFAAGSLASMQTTGYINFSGHNYPPDSSGPTSFRIYSIVPPCPADLDNDGNFANGGVRDRAVTIDDLLYFLAGFEAGNLAVDLDNGSGTGPHDGAVTVEDLLFFLVHFEAGC